MVLKRRPIYTVQGWSTHVVGYEAPARHTAIIECGHELTEHMSQIWHYSHKSTRRARISLAVLWHGMVHGFLRLGYGQNPKVNGSSAGWSIEFDRMWLSDDMPKYSETVVLGLLHAYLRARHPGIRRIRSFSDTGEGNQGTIYRAANYRHVKDSPGRFWRMPDGEKLHEVSAYLRHGPGYDALLLEMGAERITAPQRLFEYWLDGTNGTDS